MKSILRTAAASALFISSSAMAAPWQAADQKSPDGKELVLALAVAPTGHAVVVRCWKHERRLELVYGTGQKAGGEDFDKANEEGMFGVKLDVDGKEVFSTGAFAGENGGQIVVSVRATDYDVRAIAAAKQSITLSASFYGVENIGGVANFDPDGAKTALGGVLSACEIK